MLVAMVMRHPKLIIPRHQWFTIASQFIIEQRNPFIISLWSHIVITMMDVAITIEVGGTKDVSIMAGVVAMVIEVTGVTEVTMKAVMVVVARLNALNAKF
jgi:hypothetical protein